MKNERARRAGVKLNDEEREWAENFPGGISAAIRWAIAIARHHQADLARRRAIRNKERN